MTKSLRTLARGQQCMVRIPGVCNFDPQTTVLAHIRRGNTSGMGQKPCDLQAIFSCSCCHDAIDRRGYRDIPIESINEYLLSALCRQLAWYDKHEILIAVIAA